jgi:hypothetical protein
MIPNLNYDEIEFPDRKTLKKEKSKIDSTYYKEIHEVSKTLNLDQIDFENGDFIPRSEIKQSQQVFFWIRVYLKEEMEITPMTDVTITWKETNEKLMVKFICYSKKGLDKDGPEEVVNYVDEDDKKVLCLMVEEDRINKHNSDIPFLKTLFKIGRFYEKQIFRRENLLLSDCNGNEIKWFDIDF